MPSHNNGTVNGNEIYLTSSNFIDNGGTGNSILYTTTSRNFTTYDEDALRRALENWASQPISYSMEYDCQWIPNMSFSIKPKNINKRIE